MRTLALPLIVACSSPMLERSAAPPADMPAEDSKTGEVAPIPRLVRTGEVTVRVDDWSTLERDLAVWLEPGGHVADQTLSHWEGEVSWARLQVRVPAERLDALVSWIEERAEVVSLSVRSEDVTARWVDLDARLDNARRAEARLQGILDQQTGSLADVLAVERELARIRGDVESWEAQRRALSDQVTLATLHLSVEVRRPYAPLVARSFGEQAAEAWQGSVRALALIARGLALLGIAAGPWVAVLGALLAGLVGAVRLGRRLLRR